LRVCAIYCLVYQIKNVQKNTFRQNGSPQVMLRNQRTIISGRRNIRDKHRFRRLVPVSKKVGAGPLKAPLHDII
jgi:electron transfer flavoprotein alpha subunit